MEDGKGRGGDLSAVERSAIDNATYDGANWALAPGVAGSVLEQMASKGLISLSRNHWLLTPMGYLCSVHAR